MKLYTEEQVHKAFEDGYLYHAAVGLTSKEQFELQFRDTVNSLTPIELPSDEEIVKQSKYIAHNYFEMHHANHYQGLEEGSLRMAAWMRDKIQGGNQ